jgi:hypothetical protein
MRLKGGYKICYGYIYRVFQGMGSKSCLSGNGSAGIDVGGKEFDMFIADAMESECKGTNDVSRATSYFYCSVDIR